MSEPVLLESVRSFLIGKWTTIVARRLSLPDGTFVGAMVRRIDPDSYQRYFASVALADGAAISLFDREGKMLARYPHVEDLIGRSYKNAPLMQKVLSRGGQHTLRVKSPVDGEERLGSAASLTHFPLVIVATNTMSAALADWRQQTGFMVTTATLSAAVIALILFLIIRQISRQNRDAQERLEAERLRLDTALNNMSQGLVLYDAVRMHRHLQPPLSSTCSMLSHDVVKPGCHVPRGDAPPQGARRVQRRRRGVLRRRHEGRRAKARSPQDHPSSCRTAAPSRSSTRPLAQGGWIATIEDITERRNLEQERDRNYTFLREIIDHIPSQITVKDARTRQYLLINGSPRSNSASRAKHVVGKTPFDIYPDAAARLVTEDDSKALQSPKGLFKDEHAWQSQTMGLRYITSTRIGIRDNSGEPRYLINVVEDVTERRRADEKIAHMAHYDALTDLPNRTLFREQIERELTKVAGGEQFALLYIDVDEFKGINDSLGHQVGDELLKAIAGRLRALPQDGRSVARLGGDEFAVDPDRSRILRGRAVARDADLIEAIRQPYHCLGHQLATDASIGIALAPHDGADPTSSSSTPISRCMAPRPMVAAPIASSSRRWMRAPRRAAPWSRICARRSIDGGFELHYQPLVDLQTPRGLRLRGAAALAPSRARHGLAGRVHSDRRGDRPDQRARRMGAAHGLQRGRELAGPVRDRRQRLAGPVQMRHAGAADRRRAGRVRARAAAGSSSRSPRPC